MELEAERRTPAFGLFVLMALFVTLYFVAQWVIGTLREAPVFPSLHLQERVREDASRANIIEAISRGDCVPTEFRCAGNKAYLVCYNLAFGKAGVVPLYARGDESWIAATAYYLAPRQLEKVLARDGCRPWR